MNQTEFQLLQEQIKGVSNLMSSHFENVNNRLDKINGKVQTHDIQIQEALIERAKNREEQKQVKELASDNCEKIENIEKSLEDVKFFTRHPKLFVGGLAIMIVITIMTFIQSNEKISKALGFGNEPVKTEISK